jgi:hypothetical protein
MAADPKASRNALISLITSVLTMLILMAYLILIVRALKDAFPGEPLTNPQIYNKSFVAISLIFVLFVSIPCIVSVGTGSNSIRRSQAQGVKSSALAILGLSLGLLDQVLILSILVFHIYLLFQFAAL